MQGALLMFEKKISSKTGCELYAGCHNHRAPLKINGHFKNWNLLLNTQGRVRLTMNHRVMEIEAPSLTLVTPGLPREFAVRQNWNVFWIHCNLEHNVDVGAEWNEVMSGVRNLPLASSDFRNLRRLFADVCYIARIRQQGWYRLAYCIVQEIILRGNMITGRGLDTKHIELSQKLLANIDNFSTIDELAKSCSMSRAVFYRKFKETFGISPRRYRENEVMRKAQVLLEETDFTLQKIAELLNIDNTFYLSARFKKFCGMSPKIYRSHFCIITKE